MEALGLVRAGAMHALLGACGWVCVRDRFGGLPPPLPPPERTGVSVGRSAACWGGAPRGGDERTYPPAFVW